MCTITKIYKDQLQKPNENDLRIIESGLVDGRGRDGFSVTTFSNNDIVSIIRTISYEDAIAAVVSGLNNQIVYKIVIYSRARPETETELDISNIQPIVLPDNCCIFHHGIIHTINEIPVPEQIVDTVYLGQIYNSFKHDLSYFNLSPNNLVLLEYPDESLNQSIMKLAWYKYNYNSNCIKSIYTNLSENEGEALWLE